MTEYALELKNVSKQYDTFQLKQISLPLPKGCIMGLIGENGAGKSTTIKLILNLIERDSGSISVLGQPAEVFSREKNEAIGVVMDESSFPENLNRIEINRVLKLIYQNWQEKKFLELCQRLQLPEKKTVKEYSRGMKMKLSIAVALSHQAKLLILDEATSGLDPVVREEILDLFLEFIQDEECSILMSSHIVSDLEKVCDYLTYLHQGQVIFTESKDELLDHYAILKCSKEALQELDNSAIIRVRYHQFGVEAMVNRNLVPEKHVMDSVSIEDVMLFYSRGEVWNG